MSSRFAMPNSWRCRRSDILTKTWRTWIFQKSKLAAFALFNVQYKVIMSLRKYFSTISQLKYSFIAVARIRHARCSRICIDVGYNTPTTYKLKTIQDFAKKMARSCKIAITIFVFHIILWTNLTLPIINSV